MSEPAQNETPSLYPSKAWRLAKRHQRRNRADQHARMHWNLVHSFVDFNLQVNSNAALFYVFCALGAAPQTVETRARVRRTRSLHSRTPELETNNDAVEEDTPL